MADLNETQIQGETYFAPAARVSGEQLHQEILWAKNPVIDSLLDSVSGLLAVLNPQRQILAVNAALLESLGVQDAADVLGLRPGEAIQCIHARELPGGCGTSRFCSTCQAAIAIVTSLATKEPVDRECAIRVQRNGRPADLYFQVRCAPLVYEEQRFLLLFLRDITAEQQRAALERVFFHDVGNLLGALTFKSLLLAQEATEPRMRELSSRIGRLASRLAKEVEVQRALSLEPRVCQLTFQEFPLDRVVDEIRETFANHPVAEDKSLDIITAAVDLRLRTALALLHRILMNMLVNAFEATEKGGHVRFWIEAADDGVTFCVWNRQAIPPEVAQRLFQRNFTTKPGRGRGLGTYAMRLLGETYLQGRVGFTTTEADGTVFRFWLPRT